jgi:hypothetical protein
LKKSSKKLLMISASVFQEKPKSQKFFGLTRRALGALALASQNLGLIVDAA